MKNGDKRLAVLVGCNYPNTRNKLHGCINDVLTMRDILLSRFGFEPANVVLLTDAAPKSSLRASIELLTDVAPGSSLMPTGENIMAVLDRMVDRAKPGDVLFFHYSGHGTRIPSNDKLKQDLEAIVPCDFNLITDVHFRQLVNRLPNQVSFTILSDSCHSGGLIDKEEEQIGPYPAESQTLVPNANRSTLIISGGLIDKKEKHQIGPYVVESPSLLTTNRSKMIPFDSILTSHLIPFDSILTSHLTSIPRIQSPNAGVHLLEVFCNQPSQKICWGQLKLDPSRPDQRYDSGILLSGCQANETCEDVNPTVKGDKAYGAFSNAVQIVLKKSANKIISNKELIIRTRKVLQKQGFNQHPCLYCSDDNVDAPFLWQPRQPELEDII